MTSIDFEGIGLKHQTAVHKIAVILPINKDLRDEFGIKMKKI